MAFAILGLWIVVGYLFTVWFVNHFLDDHRWSDGTEVGPFGLVMITVFGPVMAFFMLMFVVFDFAAEHFGPGIRRLYGIK